MNNQNGVKRPETARPETNDAAEGQGSGVAQKSAEKRRRGVGRPIQKGQVLNPGGRPKGYAAFRELCRTKSPQAVQALEKALADGGSHSVQAARVLLEYGYGRPSAAPEELETIEAVAQSSIAAVLSRAEMLTIAAMPVPPDEEEE